MMMVYSSSPLVVAGVETAGAEVAAIAVVFEIVVEVAAELEAVVALVVAC